MTPSEYFEQLKGSKREINSEILKNSYETILGLAEKYDKTGQSRSLRRLKFLAEVLGEEEKLVDLGITTFIYRQDIEDYIYTVEENTVKIIELSNYTREIPDEIVEIVERTKDIFDQLYVVFTDYTGREERRVAQERRDKDPILFGCFKNSEFVADRFYFLGDWVDEKCDLTLDKLVEEYKTKKNIDPTREIVLPQTSQELLKALERYKIPEGEETDIFQLGPRRKKKKSFFDRIKSIWKRK